MKMVFLQIGKTDDANVASLQSEYERRVAHYAPFDSVVLPAVRLTGGSSGTNAGKRITHQKELEGKSILNFITASDHVVLLDERGRERNSAEFAQWLDACRVRLAGRLVFVVGGPFGFSDEVYAKADEMLALSKMTLPHQLVRAVFTEQLYRACTIIKGERYHH